MRMQIRDTRIHIVRRSFCITIIALIREFVLQIYTASNNETIEFSILRSQREMMEKLNYIYVQKYSASKDWKTHLRKEIFFLLRSA